MQHITTLHESLILFGGLNPLSPLISHTAVVVVFVIILIVIVISLEHCTVIVDVIKFKF